MGRYHISPDSRNGYGRRSTPFHALSAASKFHVVLIIPDDSNSLTLSQGLVFLHERRIAHRVSDLTCHTIGSGTQKYPFQDITPVNILLNCYRLAGTFDDDLRKHRKDGNIYYTIMDYDQSIILPPDTDLRTCTRPINESGHGSDVYKAWNGSFAAPTYNPFAYDVGMLGNLFRRHLRVRQNFQQKTKLMPHFDF